MTEFNLSGFSGAIADLAEKAGPAVVSLSVHKRYSVSAFHWRDGFYVAPEERLESDEEPEITFANGATARGELVGRDPSTGIALLKAAGGSAVSLAVAKDVRVGSVAITVGRSGQSALVAFGLVSEAGPSWRSMRGGLIDRRIGLSTPIGGRFEGAAALDAEGGLIGMVLFGPRRRPLVIPAETIERVAKTLAEKGHVARGYLGAGLHPVRQGTVRGAMVMSVDDDGPARQAGIHLGDIVTRWEGEAVEGPRDLIRRLGSDSVGTTVRLTILRGGAEQPISLTVGTRRSH